MLKGQIRRIGIWDSASAGGEGTEQRQLGQRDHSRTARSPLGRARSTAGAEYQCKSSRERGRVQGAAQAVEGESSLRPQRSAGLRFPSSNHRADLSTMSALRLARPRLTPQSLPRSSPLSTAPPPPNQLNWPTYLALRRSQRRYGLLASIPTTFAGFTLGAGHFASIEAEPTDLIMGIEPIYA